MDVLILSKNPPTGRVCSLDSFLRDLKIVNVKKRVNVKKKK